MKKIPVLLLASIILAFAGCESSPELPSVFRERVSPSYRTHVVAVEQKPAYEAARAALKKMNFKFTSGGAAQGKLEAINALQPGAGAGSARQVSLSVKLAPAANGGTEVSALFSEILEDAFSKREGMGTSTPMQDTPLYEVFFRHLDEELAKPVE
ncbi:MAG: hypothetical protein QM760_15440 [Nibricoccus sp.]